MTPFADLANPGQVWALRKAGDDPTPQPADTSAPPPLPGDKHLSPTQKLLSADGFMLSDYASVDPATGTPLTCLLLGTPQRNGFETDCTSTTKLGRYSLSEDIGGVAYAASGSHSAEPAVAAGRAGSAVARVVAVLDDGTRVEARGVDGGTAYAGKYFIASWSGNVPADTYLAYDTIGKQVGTKTTIYGAGGHN